MLFLKRCSDVFEERYQKIMQENLDRGRSEADPNRRFQKLMTGALPSVMWSNVMNHSF
jgi:hypothetical protein